MPDLAEKFGVESAPLVAPVTEMRHARDVAYRTLPNGEPEITIVTMASSFWLRLRTNLSVRRWSLIVMAIVGAVAAVPIAGIGMVMIATHADDLGALFMHTFAITLPIVVALFVAPILVYVIAASLKPSPNEALLPRALVLRETSLDVITRKGALVNDRWGYIIEATENPDAFDLTLRREPLMRMVLAKSRLGANEAALLRRWLIANRCMRE